MNGFDIDRRLGPLRLRAWFLVVNFVCNALALYGLSRVLVTGGGAAILAVGVVGTIVCLAVLSQPSRDVEDDTRVGGGVAVDR